MPKTIFELDEWLISGRLGTYREFLEMVEPPLEKNLQDWKDVVDSEAQQIRDEDSRAEFYEFFSDEYAHREEFRSILLHSFFVGSYAYFEHQLLRVCQRARNHSSNPFSVEDLKGNNFANSAKTYLEKLGLAFPASGIEWHDALRCRTIRNKLMHEGGSLPTTGDIADYARRKKIAVEGESSIRIELTRSFCDEALGVFERFLVKLNQAYAQWRRTKP